eukprot:366378-Chlamydomonas_euryale.AAC.2
MPCAAPPLLSGRARPRTVQAAPPPRPAARASLSGAPSAVRPVGHAVRVEHRHELEDKAGAQRGGCGVAAGEEVDEALRLRGAGVGGREWDEGDGGAVTVSVEVEGGCWLLVRKSMKPCGGGGGRSGTREGKTFCAGRVGVRMCGWTSG